MNLLIVGVLGYVLIQFLIGVLVSRNIRSEADYLIAGRRLGLGLAAFSIFATWFGAETVVGAAGAIYEKGLSGGSQDPFGYVLCIFLMGFVFARPLWRRRYTTFGDLFRERYSPGVERLAVLLLVPPSVIWAAAQIRAFGQVLSSASDLQIEITITLAAGFVIAYTVAGGLLADAWTDLIQGVALTAGLLVLGWVLLAEGGAALTQSATAERLSLFGSADQPWYMSLETWAVPVCGSVLAIELISRVLACRTAETARGACLVGGGLYLLVGLIPVMVGLSGTALLPGLEEPEQLIPLLARDRLGTVLYVVFAGALVSAILSTVDTALLSAAGLISHNIIVPLRPGSTDRDKVLAARTMVIILGAVAYVLALDADRIYDLVMTASAFGSAGVFVVGCFGLFGRGIGGAASAYAALLVGAAVWALGEYVIAWPTPYLNALAASFAAYLLAAPLGRRRAAETTAGPRPQDALRSPSPQSP